MHVYTDRVLAALCECLSVCIYIIYNSNLGKKLATNYISTGIRTVQAQQLT